MPADPAPLDRATDVLIYELGLRPEHEQDRQDIKTALSEALHAAGMLPRRVQPLCDDGDSDVLALGRFATPDEQSQNVVDES